MRLILAAIAVAITTGVADEATARDRCSVPVADWQPRRALQAKLEGEGWTVRSIRPEDGCYEAHAIDARGKKVDAFFNPKSFDPVDMSIEP